MNILIYNQYFWPENFRINDVAIALQKRGHQVDVVTGKPNYPDGVFFKGYSFWGVVQETWNSINIYRIPILARGQKSAFKLVLNYLSFILSGLLFTPWLLRKKKYDVIFVYAPSPIFQVIPASFLGWLKGVPVVLWVQDLWPQSAEATGHLKSPFLMNLLEKLVRFTYSHTDLLLVQSEAFIAPVTKLAPNIPIEYYPNSVEDDFYSPSERVIPVIESLQSGFKVLFAGNIGSAQSMKTIVSAAEALKTHADIKIVLLGSGSKLDWVAQQSFNKGLGNIHIEGKRPVEMMPLLMRQASALLVTLTNQPIFELTIPSKIQAYLAVGRPIIACLNGEGAKTVNDAQAGISVSAEDGKGLAEAVLRLYRMSVEERKKMGDNGRAYFKQHFDEEMLTSNLILKFEDLINEKGNH